MARLALIVVVSNDTKFRMRAGALKEIFEIELKSYESSDEVSEKGEEVKDAVFIIVSAIEAKDTAATAEMVQAVKFGSPNANVAVVVSKKMDTAGAEFIKKSGANSVMLENEYFENSKMEFIVSRKLHGEWIGIKTSDLIKDRIVDFSLFHLMPLNGKFLCILPKGKLLDQAHFKKYEAVGELYIKKEELEDYKKYLTHHNDASSEALKRRCRAVYISFVDSYKNLVMLMTDQSEGSSFDAGKSLFQKLNQMAIELISSLGTLGEPWVVINNSAVEDFTAIDRAPAIASYAGMLSLQLEIGKPEEVMVAALIADIGLLDLSPSGVAAWKSGQLAGMTASDAQIYKQHPLLSLNRTLSRRVPIPESIKDIILCTHERADKKGFPNQLEKEKIPKEAFLIHFSEKLDQLSVLKFGKARLKPEEARKTAVENEMKSGGAIPIDMLSNISKLMVN